MMLILSGEGPTDLGACGNAAPNSAKTQLAQAMNGPYSADQWCDWLGQDHVDLRSLESMPAFARFHQQLMAALAQAMARPTAPNPISSH